MGKLLIIGLDGADYELTKRWMDEGRLPTLARLRDDGVFGCLRSTAPPTTPVAWPSLCTGTTPAQHGVWGFQQKRAGTYEFDFVSSDSVTLPRFWHLLNAAGYTTGVMQVPLTYPPSPLDGWLVTGMFTPEGAEFAYPKKVGGLVRDRHPEYRAYLPPGTDWYAAPPAVVEGAIQRLMTLQLDVWESLVETNPCDVYFVVFQLTDWASHRFGTEAGRQGQGEFGERLLAAYQFADDAVGRCLQFAADGDGVIVVSDHGSSPLRGVIAINTWLLRNGFMRLRPGIARRAKALAVRGGKTRVGRIAARYALRSSGWLRRAVHLGAGEGAVDGGHAEGVAGLLTFDDVDWQRTRAFCIGHYPLIWVNQKGREPLGIVSPGRESDDLCSEIAAGLEAIEAEGTGERPITAVTRLDGDCTDSGAPDLVVHTRDWGYVGERLLDPSPGPLVCAPEGWPVAYHSRNGIFLANGVCSGTGSDEAPGTLEDVAPMVLRLMGMDLPPYMGGLGLTDLVRGPICTPRRAYELPQGLAEDRSETNGGTYSDEEAHNVEARLKQLGYL